MPTSFYPLRSFLTLSSARARMRLIRVPVSARRERVTGVTGARTLHLHISLDDYIPHPTCKRRPWHVPICPEAGLEGLGVAVIL